MRWNEPFWKPHRGRETVLAYIVLVHALSIAGLILFPLPDWRTALASLALLATGAIATTVCYHRALAHRALRLNPVVEHLLTFFAIVNGAGSPAGWIAYHREHHANADTPDDPSSPKHGGFWWAHLRWLWQSPPADVRRWCPEFDRGLYRFWALAEGPLLVASLATGLAWGWAGFFWLGAIRLLYSLHLQCFVNSVAHLSGSDRREEQRSEDPHTLRSLSSNHVPAWDGEGGSRDGGDDSSRNVAWLGPFLLTAWGENWHRNHHASPASPRFSRAWWQIDIGWLAIRALVLVRLARHTHACAPQPRNAPATTSTT